MITPTTRKLAGLLVQCHVESKNADSIVDHDLAREAAMAYADSIIVALRDGADAPEGQKDSVQLAEDLLSTLDAAWDAMRSTKRTRDFQSLLRDDQRLTQAVLDRLQVLVEFEPDEAAREREIRLEIAKEIIPKFGTAAHRWLTGMTDDVRFAAEQRANTLENVLVMHLGIEVDLMRIAQDTRNAAKTNGTTFSGQAISKRIFQVIA